MEVVKEKNSIGDTSDIFFQSLYQKLREVTEVALEEDASISFQAI